MKDRPSLEEAVRASSRMVASLCRRMLGDYESARDAAQDVWEEVARSWPGFRGESAASTWIYSIARRKLLALKAAARRESYRSLLLRYHIDELPAPESLGPEAVLRAKEVCDRCLQGVLFCLDPEPRLVFVFRFVVGLPYAEIARVMDREEPAVRQAASRARRLVQGFIESDCAFGGGRCSCGMDSIVRRAGLVAEFERLSSLVRKASAYRLAEEMLPKADFWRDFVPRIPAPAMESASRKPAPSH
jgi:RNA polymerase sigma-70 factor, ECF subfamily